MKLETRLEKTEAIVLLAEVIEMSFLPFVLCFVLSALSLSQPSSTPYFLLSIFFLQITSNKKTNVSRIKTLLSSSCLVGFNLPIAFPKKREKTGVKLCGIF